MTSSLNSRIVIRCNPEQRIEWLGAVCFTEPVAVIHLVVSHIIKPRVKLSLLKTDWNQYVKVCAPMNVQRRKLGTKC